MRRYIIVLLSMLAICSVPCQSQTIDRALFERMVAITKHFEGWHDPKTTPGYVGLWSPATEGRAFPENTDTSACRFAVTDRPPPAPAPICPLWQGCLSACHPLVPDWTSQVVRQWTIPESVPAHPIGTWRQGHPATLSELLQMEGKSSGIH